ncbi:TauD/TfdA family dioxygenase [Novosphingobium sp. B 225]|uniref:TauD/TfdA family dioxygenase n=1 Tax=Novosphingobium sp. B 225 TaxID=1961849 RepID=UPI000B4B67BF|nr:TauD/TfdA family dioxygenase [Novosphingobium sp. B 225]
MTVSGLEVRADALGVIWTDNSRTTYPTIWLRDNCPAGLHPQTHERLLDLLSLDPSPQLLSAEISGEHVRLIYADSHVSLMPLTLLAANQPGLPAIDPAAITPQLWHANLTPAGIPRFHADAVLADDSALRDWMVQTASYGLSIVDRLEDRHGAGVEVAQRVGFLRETNFGTTFEVISMPDPNNLAYTSVALPLHTDLPNQEVPPGFQFLHCIANESSGGGSVFADGFALAQDLRDEDPAAFQLLAEVPIPFRFHDQTADIRVRAPVITLDRSGELSEIRYNAHIAAIFDMPAEIMPDYYRAYRAYMTKTRDAAYRIEFKLAPGEMVVFDNRRILHGREAFDPSTGFRHLHGCYVDRGEFNSRLRLLAR